MKPKIGITMGDPAGVGPEVVVKALMYEAVMRDCVPIVIGDRGPLRDAAEVIGATVRIVEVGSADEALGRSGEISLLGPGALADERCEYGTVSAVAGEAAFAYVRRAIALATGGSIHAVVTGPISKEALRLAGHEYAGHTEIFADLTGTSSYAMMLVNDGLRVIHVSTHVSLRKACDLVSVSRVLEVIELAQAALVRLGITNPRIAVAGLNPHSSEGGLFGDEEEREIIPGIRAAQRRGIDVSGPVPPDTVFVRALGGEWDVVVAMYHDQGHIPLKLHGFSIDGASNTATSISGVNWTVGLPIIRTSVDHGTAFDRAGTGTASEKSMVDAIRLAVRIVSAEKQFGEGGKDVE